MAMATKCVYEGRMIDVSAGCEPLTISAALLGQAEPWRNVGEVPFHCGE